MAITPITKEIIESKDSNSVLLKNYFNDGTPQLVKETLREKATAWIKDRKNWNDYAETLIKVSGLDINNTKPGGQRAIARMGCLGTKYYGCYVNEDGTGLPGGISNPSDMMKHNINYISQYLSNAGWNNNAIAAVIGNIYCECSLNPGNWEGGTGNIGTTSGSRGYGLVQWTSAWEDHFAWCMGLTGKTLEDLGLTDNATYRDEIANIFFSDPSSIDAQLAHLVYDMEPRFSNRHWYHFKDYPGYEHVTRGSFIKGEDKNGNPLSIGELAKAFMVNYLRPSSVNSDTTRNYRANVAIELSKYMTVLGFKMTPRINNKGVADPVLEPFYNKTNSHGQSYKCSYNGNCTWYAYGRSWELNAESNFLDANSSLSELNKIQPKYLRYLGNAGTWYSKLESNNDFPKDRLSKTVPKLGAVICWKALQNRIDNLVETRGGKASDYDGWGHVAVVEEITYDDNGNWKSLRYSESGYPNLRFSSTGTLTPSDTSYGSWSYQLEGFIYNEHNFISSQVPKENLISEIYQNKNKLSITFLDNLPVPVTDVSVEWRTSFDGAEWASIPISYTTAPTSMLGKKTISLEIPPFTTAATVFITTDTLGTRDLNNIYKLYPCTHLYRDKTSMYETFVPFIYHKGKWKLTEMFRFDATKWYRLSNKFELDGNGTSTKGNLLYKKTEEKSS